MVSRKRGAESGFMQQTRQFGIGQPVRRVEDRRFITGRGIYVDDIVRPRQAHAVMLRSPHAHARIHAIDTTAAAALPGVLAVLTGADLAADGIGNIPCLSRAGGELGIEHLGMPMTRETLWRRIREAMTRRAA
jgi:CO/xanthine dehydrogenase Mo-binding subunit